MEAFQVSINCVVHWYNAVHRIYQPPSGCLFAHNHVIGDQRTLRQVCDTYVGQIFSRFRQNDSVHCIVAYSGQPVDIDKNIPFADVIEEYRVRYPNKQEMLVVINIIRH